MLLESLQGTHRGEGGGGCLRHLTMQSPVHTYSSNPSAALQRCKAQQICCRFVILYLQSVEILTFSYWILFKRLLHEMAA